jgi:mercuric ion transport protein
MGRRVTKLRGPGLKGGGPIFGLASSDIEPREKNMDSAAPRTVEPSKKLTAASVGGAIVAAFASSLCCVGPLLFAALGLGGAGLLVKLEAYRPYFAALTLVLLGAGFYFTYRRPRLAPEGAAGGPACDCELPRANRLGRVMLWIAAAVVAGLLGFPYLAQVLFT